MVLAVHSNKDQDYLYVDKPLNAHNVDELGKPLTLAATDKIIIAEVPVGGSGAAPAGAAAAAAKSAKLRTSSTKHNLGG